MNLHIFILAQNHANIFLNIFHGIDYRYVTFLLTRLMHTGYAVYLTFYEEKKALIVSVALATRVILGAGPAKPLLQHDVLCSVALLLRPLTATPALRFNRTQQLLHEQLTWTREPESNAWLLDLSSTLTQPSRPPI